MVDLTVTAANVVKGTDAVVQRGVAGATITAGQPLYKDATASDTLKVADTDVSAAASRVVGIALHAASTGQPIEYQTDGEITIGATMTVGEIYVLSGTAGGIAPRADLATLDYTSIIGIAKTAAILSLKLHNLGVALA